MAYSDDDGVTWSGNQISLLIDDLGGGNYRINPILSIAHGNNMFVAVGHGGKMAYSNNGASWTAVNNNPFDEQNWIHGIAYGNGRFVASANDKMVYSDNNGTTWTVVEKPGNWDSWPGLDAIAYGNGRFVGVFVVSRSCVFYADW